ncbi:5951_t:CDS:2 [Paraglomus occultum]|uniref:5951_t:CDS:1 n=1 Tax=Paraglomus occultum TaxID=144539 RepID=A0A9N8WK15_9GLOM|nr:5951_t:CDS:2 [Paraglomus occultum]
MSTQDVSSAHEIYDDDNERRNADTCQSSTPMVPHNANLQKHLRQEILIIQNDRDLSAGEKAKKVQDLMMSNWKALSKKSTRVVSNRLTEDDLAPTYVSMQTSISIGCKTRITKHFDYSFSMVLIIFIPRTLIKKFWVVHTIKELPSFKLHAVEDGSLVDSVMTKPAITKLTGMKQKKCFACIVQRSNLRPASAVPVIATWRVISAPYAIFGIMMLPSRSTTAINVEFAASAKDWVYRIELAAGLSDLWGVFIYIYLEMHVFGTYEELRGAYQCPTCWKALANMRPYYDRIDAIVSQQSMPPEYDNYISLILCNDCEKKSNVKYHFLYHKCPYCKGYNTRVLETEERVGMVVDEREEEEDEIGEELKMMENNGEGRGVEIGIRVGVVADVPDTSNSSTPLSTTQLSSSAQSEGEDETTVVEALRRVQGGIAMQRGEGERVSKGE